MNTEKELPEILSAVVRYCKYIFKEKLVDVILFGSYARGDFDGDSDVDLMILADVNESEINDYTRKIYDCIYSDEPEYDLLLSLCIVPEKTYIRYRDVLPFYRNVEKEGIKIAV